MERRSVELADTVICGSAHLLGWMREAGYALPARSFVWPNVFPAPDSSPASTAGRTARNNATLQEIVFVGRLEPRKGLVLFVDAMDRLVRLGWRRRASPSSAMSRPVSTALDSSDAAHGAGRPKYVRSPISEAEETISYLSRPGRLAVIPSLLQNSSLAIMECLQTGIPFVATATGGTPELVASDDRHRALVAPNHIALGDRIVELAGVPLRAVRPVGIFEHSLNVWSHWHARKLLLKRPQIVSFTEQGPLAPSHR